MLHARNPLNSEHFISPGIVYFQFIGMIFNVL